MESNAKDVLPAALSALGLDGARLESSETRATDTRVWRVRHQGRSLAIRVFREEQRKAMIAEVEAMQLAIDHGVPAPHILSTALIDERLPAMAIDWLEGDTVGDRLMRSPRLADRLGTASGRLLARIHCIDHPDRQFDQSWIDFGMERDAALYERLLILTGGRCSLIHLDFHPFNLMAIGGRLNGVLDWTNATFGDPRADIARTLAIMQVIAPALIARRGAYRMALGRYSRAFLRGYSVVAGKPVMMAPFMVLAGKRMLWEMEHKFEALPLSEPERFLDDIRCWTDIWRTRAGLG